MHGEKTVNIRPQSILMLDDKYSLAHPITPHEDEMTLHTNEQISCHSTQRYKTNCHAQRGSHCDAWRAQFSDSRIRSARGSVMSRVFAVKQCAISLYYLMFLMDDSVPRRKGSRIRMSRILSRIRSTGVLALEIPGTAQAANAQ